MEKQEKQDELQAVLEALAERSGKLPEFDMGELQAPLTIDLGEDLERDVALQFYGSASSDVGPITKGMNRFGFTKGQWSLIDLIGHCVSEIGPADLFVSTWTAAHKDIGFASGMLRDGRIRSARWLLDTSFAARQPAYLQALLVRFGLDAVRVTKNHAKFCVLRNEEFDLVIRTTMNLNLNKRFEFWEISDHKGFADFFQTIMDEIWSSQKPGECVNDIPSVLRQFHSMGGVTMKNDVLEAVLSDLDDHREKKREKGKRGKVEINGFFKI